MNRIQPGHDNLPLLWDPLVHLRCAKKGTGHPQDLEHPLRYSTKDLSSVSDRLNECFPVAPGLWPSGARASSQATSGSYAGTEVCMPITQPLGETPPRIPWCRVLDPTAPRKLNLVKSWGSSQVYAQTPRANIMKWLVLQLLTLYCLGILPASGNWKERIDSLDEFPIYIFPKLKLKPCPKIPTDEHCVTNCQLHSECQIGHRCCRAFCGNVCMLLKETGSSSRNNKISNMMSTVEPLNRQ
nr:protein WFDC9 isoform X2 [Equus asinus]XP_044604587.1 protein WFDC9 isoform X2 [Equus asinus]